MKKALIAGITGQDGSYLLELLLEKGYEVHGIIRRTSVSNFSRIEHIINDVTKKDRVFLHFGDLSSSSNILRLIDEIQPDEIYNLAAQSQVYVSFEIPEYTSEVTGLGAIRLLEAIRVSKKKIKYFQAASCEIFGLTQEIPQKETTSFYPKNPYGISKLYAYHMTGVYRQTFNMFNCSGILFNHESPRRSENFVTRKITKAIAKIVSKKQDELYLGNLDDQRDWGFAKDYVEAMWLMLQQDKCEDYIVATGETHSVRDFLNEAFALVNLDWQKYVKIDEQFLRPLDKKSLFVGDATKAYEKLGWKPKTSFKELVRLMVQSDLKEEGITL
ncbi:MAG: GDP-mannose 4,6-dehydratase [Endomicrobiaceae bacterium]|jgi:GDPmannose 4,6-dehydratase|nr:GDP-mannose 4,6-dehydratase [Endomicrobiaceae bacterium]